MQSKIDLPSNKKFGLVMGTLFLLIGFYCGKLEIFIASKFLLFSGLLFLIIAIIKADLLLPLNKLWMRLGFVLGMIVNPIVMAVIFFGLFTPISFMMRIFGRDELKLKMGTSKSCWRLKDQKNSGPESFNFQF